MSFEEIMEIMLPPVDPHITYNSDGSINDYDHPRDRNNDGDTTDEGDSHKAVDFNYEGGQFNGINRKKPHIHSPVKGVVKNDPTEDKYGSVIIEDADGNKHMILHLYSFSVKKNDAVVPGQIIGRMGGRGPTGATHYDSHIHYQINNSENEKIDPEEFWKSYSPTEISSEVPAKVSRDIKEIYINFLKPDAGCNNRKTKLGKGTKLGSNDNDTILMVDNLPHKIDAGPGNDYVKTGSGNDTLKGGRGKDVLEGGDGDDTYVYDPGDNNDDIFEAPHYALNKGSKPNNNTLKFGKCISFNDIESTFDDNNLVIYFKNNPDDSITIHDWIVNSQKKPGSRSWWLTQRRIENFEFSDGTKLTAAEFLNSLGTKNDDNIKWNESGLEISTKAGDDTIILGDHPNSIDAGPGKDIVKTGAGPDNIKGGPDDDTLEGGDGNDRYYFDRGDGKDVISDASKKPQTPNPGNDTIEFGSGIFLKNIETHFEDNDLIISFTDTPNDLITIKNWRNNGRIENFEFASGLKLNVKQFLSTLGTEENDFINWDESDLKIKTKGGNDTILLDDHFFRVDAGSGNDTIKIFNGQGFFRGGTGDDTITVVSYSNSKSWINGGSGKDILTGGHGKDTFRGGSEKDTINGHYGKDTIRGDGGDDILNGGGDDDTYIYYEGDDHDEIFDRTYGGNAGNDTLQFGPGISKKDITFSRDGSDLIINIGDDGQVKIINQANPNNAIENILLDNGRRLSPNVFNSMVQDMTIHAQDDGAGFPRGDDHDENAGIISIVAPDLQQYA